MRDTRDNIVQAFFELAEANPTKTHFTITEIAKAAHVSRQTIYAHHFQNMEDILSYIHDVLTQELIKIHENYPLNSNFFVFFQQNILPALYKYRRELSILYSSSVDPTWRHFLVSSYKDWFKKSGLFPPSHHLDVDTEFKLEVFVQILISIVASWLTQEHPLPPELFAQQFRSLIDRPFREML